MVLNFNCEPPPSLNLWNAFFDLFNAPNYHDYVCFYVRNPFLLSEPHLRGVELKMLR